MRFLRSVPVLAVLLALPLLGAAPAQGCEISSARIIGSFASDGAFEVTSAMTAEGKAVPELAGAKLATVSAADDVSLPASNAVGRTLWLVGDVDGDAGTLTIAGWTDDEAAAMKWTAQHASAGSSCSTKKAAKQASYGSSCSSEGAAAKTASYGSSCSSKGAAAKTVSAGSSCSSKGAAAKTASAGSSCSSKGAAAKTASAGSSCSAICGSTKGAAAKTASAGSSCSSSKAAAASASCAATCGPKASAASAGCGSKTDAATADYTIVYRVSGMSCDSSAEKVRAAIAGLEFESVRSVDVDIEQHQAVIHCTSDDVCRKSVQKAITAAGFPAELIVRAEPQDEAETTTRS